MYETIGNWIPVLIPAFMLLDLFVQRRRYDKPRFWRVRGLVVTAAIFLFTGQVAAFWAGLLGDYHLFNLSSLGPFAGAAIGVLVYEVFHYLYHRAVHESPLLWRYVGHQVHHSAESLDAWGAHYLHPLDAAMFTTGASLAFVPLLGLSLEATILGALFLTFNGMFQHANIATPCWVGWFIQRPESHNIHHARGVHRWNYSDLPIIDMLFGTYWNPRNADDIPCGFYPGASVRLFDMLLGRDVSEPDLALAPDTAAQFALPGERDHDAIRDAA